MIFPIPYTKGTKLKPIIGVSTSTYPVDNSAWVTTINSNLSNINGKASLVNSYNMALFTANWKSRFWVLPTFVDGYQYVLIPKVSPAFPRYYYFADVEEYNTGDGFLMHDINYMDEYAIPLWDIVEDFEYNNNLYTLYCIITQANPASDPPNQVDHSFLNDFYLLNSVPEIDK